MQSQRRKDEMKKRCSVFPWLKAQHRHHTNYHRYKEEIPWLDLVPVSKTGHWVIHGLAGGVGWMDKAVTRQNQIARALPLTTLWKYPNPVQRLLHLWCRIPIPGKVVLILILVYTIN